jgi:hypothetical protein
MIFLVATFAVIGWIFLLLESRDHIQTKKLLDAAYKNTYKTPIKELAAEFRSFVKSVDGQVSEEVEQAIKKLETEEPKALPAPKQTKCAMTNEVVRYITDDFRACLYDNERVAVVKRWGKKYIFSLASQQSVIKGMVYGKGRDQLREYFDKYHNN